MHPHGPRGRLRPLCCRGVRRLGDERGIALVMALGILVVLGISATSVAYYSSSQSRSASIGEKRRSAYSLAEAGMNAGLSVLENSLEPTTATALPSCQAPATPASLTLDGGSATYCGDLDTASYIWSLTSTGTAPNPTGAAPLTETLHRTVRVQGISDGATVSAWSRFYQDSPTQCLTVDTVTIPGSVAAQHCLTLKNGARITGSNTSVDVGGNLTIDSPAQSSARAPGTGSGWTNPSSIRTSDNAYATSTIAAGGTSPNLDATNFGFSVPAGSTILGIAATAEKHEATQGSVTYDTASSGTSASNTSTLSWSHTVANQSSRVLVVGVTAKNNTSATCNASTVTYNGAAMTKISQNVTSTTPYVCASLWYLDNPASGTHTVSVTWSASLTNKSGGAVGLYGVKAGGPEASSSSSSTSGATSTSLTTLTSNAWVVDVFGSGSAANNLAPAAGQTVRWTQDSGAAESSGTSTKPVSAPGSTSVTWTQTGVTRSAAVAAAFAPLGDLADQDVYLLKNGAPAGTDHATANAWTTADSTQTYGGQTDLWGTAWTAADVNASNFGLRLAVRNSSATASNTASVDYVTVTVYYAPSMLGADSATPIGQANVSGTCVLGAQGGHAPCGSADNVFASTTSTTAQNLGKPTIDLDYWWHNAKPGPKHPCTVSSGPVPTFDNNAGSTNTYDRSLTDNGEITPENASYTCQVWENGVLAGELSWDRTTRVLKVKGTIFRDGNFRFDDDGKVTHYQGRAIIYAPGQLEFDEQVCAGGSGTASCFGYPYPSASAGSWDPTQNLLILLTGNTGPYASEYDQGATRCSPSGTAACPNGYLPGGFQGIVYSNGECVIHQQFQISGPVMCDTITIQNGQNGDGDGFPTFYSWPDLGPLIDGQIYVNTATADTFQLVLGPSDG
jgi:Tfp pilus assembly protein PilX